MSSLQLVGFGECMAELCVVNPFAAKVSFAGDVYNSLIYAKRWYNSIDSQFISAVGNDDFSHFMLDDARRNRIITEDVLHTNSYNLGLYTIKDNTRTKENAFNYWRKDSAASHYFDIASDLRVGESVDSVDTKIPHNTGIVFFSGISLGILSDKHKSALFTYLQSYQKQGFLVAFDPNYRTQLWNNQDHARSFCEMAYYLADIILVSGNDQFEIFGHQELSEVKEYFTRFSNKELVIRYDKRFVHAVTPDGETRIPAEPVYNFVDATAADDAFSGVYLASRLAKSDVKASIRLALGVSDIVKQHQGAIVPESDFAAYKSSLLVRPDYM